MCILLEFQLTLKDEGVKLKVLAVVHGLKIVLAHTVMWGSLFPLSEVKVNKHIK